MSHPRIALWLVFALGIAMIWGNYESIGHAAAEPPHALRMTATWWVLGWQPCATFDDSGGHLHWGGLWLGLLVTALLVALVVWADGRLRRAE